MAVQDLSASDLIRKISIRSDRYGDKLLEFMEEYELTGLRDATVEQLQEFIKKCSIGSSSAYGAREI